MRNNVDLVQDLRRRHWEPGSSACSPEDLEEEHSGRRRSMMTVSATAMPRHD